MQDSRRSAWGIIPLVMALGTLLMSPATADDPLTTITDLGADTVTFGTDSVADAVSGCTPVVRSWSPNELRFEGRFTSGGTVFYDITGGGTAHLNCAARVKIRARVSDASVPPNPTYTSPYSTVFTTNANPSANATVTVPYVGIDGAARPWGYITVRAEVFRRLSSGRYAPMPYGCMEWRYTLVPAASLLLSDPFNQGPCVHDNSDLAAELVDGISQQEAPRP